MLTTYKEFSLEFDYEDYINIWLRYEWSFYRKELYFRSKTPEKIYLHRMITKCPEGMIVDHIDRNRLNFCKSNLRICTRAQNNYNRPGYNEYKGVIWQKNKFIAQIMVEGKIIRLGRFSNKKEAALVYNDAAKKYFGAYAFLNII